MSTENRNPTPDAAEKGAFFPSPYSLSQYTSDETNFDGLAIETGEYSGSGRVLVIATEERYMLMQNDTMFSTGNHPVETLLPLHHVIGAGFKVTIATRTGAPAKFEWWAFPREDYAVNATWEELREQFRSPASLADVVAGQLGPGSDYLGVFIPGGHGAMLKLNDSPEVASVIDWAQENDKLVITLCHGPAALLASSSSDGASPFTGYRVCAFPDSLDQGANVDIGYLPGQMPWALGEALTKAGLELANDDMTGATARDRNLLSGDSPLAANDLGKMAARALIEQATNEDTSDA
ncbi:glyoxalase III HchA [Flexivirga caeni]|nr:glyoxalase III HchA [Flexivirga caeni]